MSKINNKLTQLREFQRTSGKSLQFLINEAYRILENPIILYDLDWKVLSYAEEVIIDDPIWNNHINSGTISKEIKDFLINEGFPEMMASQNPVVFLYSDKLKYNRIFAKIYGEDGIVMTLASVVASNRPFEDDDLVLTEGICKRLSKEIAKIDYYKSYGRKKLEHYINNLIRTDVKNNIYEIYFVELVYDKLKNHIYVAVADISQCDPAFAKLEYYKDLFRELRPSFKYSVYLNYIVIIMSTDEEVIYPKRFFNRLNSLFEKENIKVGISSRFENLFNLRSYYNEAVKALTDGLKADSSQHIFVYSDEAGT